jgi:hypothetical protein
MLGVHGVGEACSKRIQGGLNAGDFLIADLQLAGKLSSSDSRGDVRSLRENVLQTSDGIGLHSELKALTGNHQRRPAVGGERQAAVAGIDLGNVHKIRELIDELLALVDEWPSVLS